MWPLKFSVPPEVKAFRFLVDHIGRLDQASSDLASCAQMVLLQSGLSHSKLTEFPACDWPTFTPPNPATEEALKRKYNLRPGVPLSSDDGASMFTEVRDFAMAMHDYGRIMLFERYLLSPLEDILPAWLTGIRAVQNEKWLEIVASWKKVQEQEEELQGWLDGVAALGGVWRSLSAVEMSCLRDLHVRIGCTSVIDEEQGIAMSKVEKHGLLVLNMVIVGGGVASPNPPWRLNYGTGYTKPIRGL